MKRLLMIAFFLAIAVRYGSAQKATSERPIDDRDPTGLIQNVIAERGVDRWTPNEILMGLTRPPMQPVHAIPEWAKSRAVLFAIDSDIAGSIALNTRVRTANSPDGIYNKKPEVAEILNEVICQPAAEADEGNEDADTADADPGTADPVEPKENSQCDGDQLDAVTLDRTFDRLAMAHDFITLVSGLSRYVDVILLVNSSRADEIDVQRLINHLKAFDAAQVLLASPHVFFSRARFDTKWIRDYGPIFVLDPSGAIVVVDTRYDLQSTGERGELKRLVALTRQSSRQSASGVDAARRDTDDRTDDEDQTRTHDDQAPTMLATRLRQRDGVSLRRHPVSVVRPPIVLPGGDFLTDGVGTGFTSNRTLRDNGGNVEMLDLNFEKYMGIQNVVYLHPLPGETVKHIDMFLQIAAPNVLLLGKFSTPPSNPAEARLQSAAAAALEDDLQIIRDHYQRMGKTVKIVDDDTAALDAKAINIIRIPMPPVARPFTKLLLELLQEYDSADKDAFEHQTTLRMLSRFRDRLTRLEENRKGLDELIDESSKRVAADEHDFEVFTSTDGLAAELQKAVSRYAMFSNEHAPDRDAINAAAEHLKAALEALRTPTAHEDKSLDLAGLKAADSSFGELLEAGHTFLDHIRGDKDKTEGQSLAAQLQMREIEEKYKSIVTQYEDGTDLYRTYLNLLPLRTSSSFVLAVPTYRDPALRGLGEIATKRIQAVYRQLYGEVNVVPAPSDAVIKELGSVHCLTKVLPAGIEFLSSDQNRANSGALQ